MAQRNFFHGPQMPTVDPDQIWSHPHPDSHLHLGNGSIMYPSDGAASSVGLRPNDYPSSSFSNYTATNSGPLHDPYLHPSSIASSSRFPPDQVLCMPPPSFNQQRGSMLNPHTEIGRAALKRKHPAMPLAFSGGNTSGYYSAGSSSNPHISSTPLPPNPMTRPQYWSSDPASITQGYRNDNLLTVGENSQRNVRSRHDHHTHHVDVNPAVAYSSDNLHHHFHGAGNLSGLSIEGQLSHVQMPIALQGRNLSSDYSFYYEGNQSLAGASVVNNTVGTSGVFPPNLTQSRNTSSLPTLHDPLTRGIRAGSNGYHQRANPYYRSSSSYTPVGFAIASVESGGTSGMESVALSRYSRPLSVTGRSRYRNGRMRSSYNRSQSSYDEDSTRGRWLSEGAVTMDRSTFYDSRNWFDQHRDMRLDIDNMSYEELLALEERIGNVRTGLSEEIISGCLQEITHCSPNLIKDDQAGNCVICLEEYKDQDKLGRLSCRHDFHVSCIKNWLRIKNACPICKAAAFSDSLKEKQT